MKKNPIKQIIRFKVSEGYKNVTREVMSDELWDMSFGP